MTDDTTNPTPTPAPKKRTGWPKGKSRKPAPPSQAMIDAAVKRAMDRPSLISKMKARPNWDDDTLVNMVEGSDRLRIPEEILDQLTAAGIAVQWITRSVRGQDAPQELGKMTKGGWTPVSQSDFDGILDGLFMPKGKDDVIAVEDCMLVVRPMSLHLKAKMRDAAAAREPLQIKQQELGRGIPVPGGDHPSATRQNKIDRTVERIVVPE